MERTHRRVVVQRHGGPDVLEAVEEPIPTPGPGEVRVQVLAAGVSGYDLMFRRSGRLPGTPKVPFTLGADLVGVVDALGDEVSGPAPGQVVAGASLSRAAMGCYAEYVCLPASEVVPVPTGVDPVEAVCLPVNYLTAAAMMQFPARTQRGERVLVHGAAGGVGSALLQLGGLFDLELYGTASSSNLSRVAALGATPLDYRTDVVGKLRDLTGDGVDIVFDPVGGAQHLWQSYQALRAGGRLVWFGVAASRDRGLGVIPGTLAVRVLLDLLPDGKHAPTAPDLAKLGTDWYRTTLDALLRLLAARRLNPVVAARIPLVEASRAHEILERGGHSGKVVLVT